MGFILIRTLEEDNAVVVRDQADGREFVLRAGQWPQVQAVQPDQQRRVVERFVAQNLDVDNPRTDAETGR
jgi:ribosomal protein L4